MQNDELGESNYVVGAKAPTQRSTGTYELRCNRPTVLRNVSIFRTLMLESGTTLTSGDYLHLVGDASYETWVCTVSIIGTGKGFDATQRKTWTHPGRGVRPDSCELV